MKLRNTILLEYTNKLRVKCTHLKSGEIIFTDAPVDNEGKGESFSPTDLLITSLSSCIITVMGIKAMKNGLNIEGIQAHVKKIMSNHPRRIAGIKISISDPKMTLTRSKKEMLLDILKNCPVCLSLDKDIEVKINFL